MCPSLSKFCRQTRHPPFCHYTICVQRPMFAPSDKTYSTQVDVDGCSHRPARCQVSASMSSGIEVASQLVLPICGNFHGYGSAQLILHSVCHPHEESQHIMSDSMTEGCCFRSFGDPLSGSPFVDNKNSLTGRSLQKLSTTVFIVFIIYFTWYECQIGKLASSGASERGSAPTLEQVLGEFFVKGAQTVLSARLNQGPARRDFQPVKKRTWVSMWPPFPLARL